MFQQPLTNQAVCVLAVLSVIGYALQNTLMTTFYRQHDRLSAVAYRGISLGVTMLPLIFFVPLREQPSVLPVLLVIFSAALAAALGNWTMAIALSALPIGIAIALGMSLATVVVVICGYFVFNEALSVIQLAMIAAILLGTFMLAVIKVVPAPRASYHIGRGVISCIVFGVVMGASFVMVGFAARQSHPFIVGYIWEFSIGVMAVALALLRGRVGGAGFEVLSQRNFLKLALFSSPTVLGTGAYAVALANGPVAIVSAIGATSMVFSTLFARFIFKEKLMMAQWFVLFFVCGSVAALVVYPG